MYEEYTSGGLIHYTEYPDVKNNIEAIETVWNYSYDTSMYLGTNCPVDKCFDCKFEGEALATENGYVCPDCQSKNLDVIKRICGYLGNPQQRPLNKGKQEEINHRVKHQ